MTSLVSAERAPASIRFSDVPLLVLCLVGIALYIAGDMTSNPGRLLKSLGDTDDATRLTQVRLLMSGAPWYDMTIARFGGAEPLVSHWSRIIDLPLAAMIGFFKPFAGVEKAELLARFIWPILVLFSLLMLVARAVEVRSDRIGAFTSVLLTITTFSAMGQFTPGRIDHHNMMILGAVGGVLLLAESFSKARMGWWAGAMLALGTAVGYEALSLTVAVLAIANLQVLATGRGGAGVVRASLAFAAALVVLMLATVGPSQLLVPRCDQISPNFVILAVFGAAGSVVAHGPLATASWRLRFAALAGLTLVGAGIYAMIEPACLKGPFGQVYPAAVPIWLDKVLESQNILWLLRNMPSAGVAGGVFVLAGFGASAWLAWRKPSDASILLFAINIAALPLAFWQIKLMAYATMLAVISLSVLTAELASRSTFSPPVVRAVLSVLASQPVMFAIFNPAVEAMSLTPKAKLETLRSVGTCLETKSITPLASLPPGLAVNDIDLGPVLAALTRLDAVAAPYHRIGKPIADADGVLFGPIAEAEAAARRLKADYIALCTPRDTPATQPGLRYELLHGQTPAWLEPVPVAGETPVKVWRIKR